MPAGNITNIDRFKRLNDVKRLQEEGKTQEEIADAIGASISTVKRYAKYLKELAVADLTNDEIGAKRAELYMELIDATDAAKEEFDKYRASKDKNAFMAARKFHMSWLESLKLRAQLYGLDNIKIGALTQINQQFNLPDPGKINKAAGEKIARLIKDNHERKAREKHDEKAL